MIQKNLDFSETHHIQTDADPSALQLEKSPSIEKFSDDYFYEFRSTTSSSLSPMNENVMKNQDAKKSDA